MYIENFFASPEKYQFLSYDVILVYVWLTPPVIFERLQDLA